MSDLLEPLDTNDPDYLKKVLQAATALANIGEYQQALRLIRKSLKSRMNRPNVLTLTGQIYTATGDFEKAEACLRRAVKVSGKGYIDEAKKILGKFLIDRGQIQEGLELLCQHIIEEEDWRDKDILTIIAEVAREKREARAVETLKQAWEHTLDVEVGYFYALSIRDHSPNDDAVRVFELIVKRAKKSTYWNQLGISYARQNRYKESSEAFQKAIEIHQRYHLLSSLIDESSPEDDADESSTEGDVEEKDLTLATYHANLSYAYRLLLDGQKALQEADRAIKIGNKLVTAWVRYIEALNMMEMYEDSVSNSEQIIERFGQEDISEIYKLLLTALEALNRSEAYAKWFERAIQKYPDQSAFYTQAVDYWVNQGKYEQAVDVLEAAIKAFPSDVMLQYERVILLYLLRKKEQAWEALLPFCGSYEERFTFYEWLFYTSLPYLHDNLTMYKALLLDLLERAREDDLIYVLYTSVLLDEDNYPAAEEYLKKALTFAKLGLIRGVDSLMVNNLAYAQMKQNKIEDAVKSLESIELSDAVGSEFVSDEALYYRLAIWGGKDFHHSAVKLPLRYTPQKAVFDANRVAIALAQGKMDEAISLVFALSAYEPITDEDYTDRERVLQVTQFLTFMTMGCVAVAKGDEAVGVELWAKSASFVYFDDLLLKPANDEENQNHNR